MKRYNVICIGYKEPDIEKIRELVKFEDSWLEQEKAGRKILIHPGICIRETENYNRSVLAKLGKYNEYNLDAAELGTKYDFNARFEYKIAI